MSKLSVVLALCLPLFAGACSSGPSSRDDDGGSKEIEGSPLRVSYLSFSSGQHLELVNEAHTGRVEQYSQVRNDASRKVQTNDVMTGLIEVLEKNGFRKHAIEGGAPVERGVMAWALEIEDDKGLRHVGAVPGLSADDNRDLLRLAAAFIDTYNSTYSLQAIKLEPGKSAFGELEHKK